MLRTKNIYAKVASKLDFYDAPNFCQMHICFQNRKKNSDTDRILDSPLLMFRAPECDLLRCRVCEMNVCVCVRKKRDFLIHV